MDFCDEVITGKDSTIQLRTDLQSMYNKYVDGCFCERIAEMINMDIKS